MGSYWANKRRKAAQAGKPLVISSEKRIEFRIDEISYTYVYKTDSRSGFAYIYKNDTGVHRIYGPYETDRTEEGMRVYNLLTETKTI